MTESKTLVSKLDELFTWKSEEEYYKKMSAIASLKKTALEKILYATAGYQKMDAILTYAPSEVKQIKWIDISELDYDSDGHQKRLQYSPLTAVFVESYEKMIELIKPYIDILSTLEPSHESRDKTTDAIISTFYSTKFDYERYAGRKRDWYMIEFRAADHLKELVEEKLGDQVKDESCQKKLKLIGTHYSALELKLKDQGTSFFDRTPYRSMYDIIRAFQLPKIYIEFEAHKDVDDLLKQLSKEEK